MHVPNLLSLPLNSNPACLVASLRLDGRRKGLDRNSFASVLIGTVDRKIFFTYHRLAGSRWLC